MKLIIHRRLSIVLLILLLVAATDFSTSNAFEVPSAVKTTNTINIAKRIELVTFYSNILKTQKQYAVVLPAAYHSTSSATVTCPVLFLFHGRGRSERSLIDDPVSCAALLTANFVTVLLDGDDGWYINSPQQPKQRYEKYTAEVIQHATVKYHLSTARTQRGLSGWSMGGYGATLFAAKHNSQFCAVAPIIGLLDFPRIGLPEGQSYDVPHTRFSTNPTTWRQFNPINHANKLKSTQLLIITADQAFDRTMNRNFADRLKELDIPFQFTQLKGTHSFDIVRKALPLVIRFMNKSLTPEAK